LAIFAKPLPISNGTCCYPDGLPGESIWNV
jgi:hypothetical protein